MKKFFKFLGSAAVLCATVAGGIFAYKKFFAPDPFEDDFSDEPEDDVPEEDSSERGYVSLTSPEDQEAEEAAPETDESQKEEAAGTAASEETTEE